MNVLLRKKIPILLLVLLTASRLMASPDCPIITGNFAGLSDGTTVNNSSTGWYLNAANVASTGYFAVKSNRLHAQELGGEGIWYSKVFSTAGYSEFQVAVKITSEGDMNSSEYVRIYYKINGGAETLLDQRTGNFGTIDFISPVLTGSNVQLVVKIYNYNNGGSQTSKYYVEEYRVFKDKGPCGSSIPVSAAAGNGGVITCTNSSVTLSASSSASGVTWSWTGPNGYSSTSQNPVVSVPGTYTITGTSSSGSGSASVTVTQNTTAPVATATGGTLACGTSVTLSATSSISGSSYSWTGPNGFTSSQQNPTVSVAGNYTVTVTNTANGCTDTETVTVTTGANTPVAFWTEDFTFANGTTVDNGATSWSLSNVGTGTFSVQSNELMAAFNAANEGTWSSGSINISGKNNINFSVNLRSNTASSSDYLEEDDYIRVYYRLNGGAETLIFEDYAGLNGVNNGSASATVTSPIPTGSTLQIVVKLRNSHSTERYYVDNVVISGVTAGTGDSVATSVSGIATCTANAQIFATASSTASAWSWTGPNGFTSSVQNPVVNAGGQYVVTATLSGGCTVSAVATVTENKTAPDLTASGGDLACLSGVVINANSTVAGATYSWTGPNSFSSTSKNPTVTTAGTYTVTVTNPANGCTNSQAVTVTAGYGTPSTQWSEDFTFANGTTSDNGATSWSTSVSPSTGVIAVNSNQMRITNVGTTGEAVWTSGSINIAGLNNIGISAGVRSSVSGSGDMDATGDYADYIRFYYRLNGGAEVLFAERVGTINSNSTTLSAVSVGSLSGSTLQIVVRVRATGDNEFYHFDNVTVTGASVNSLTATASAGGIITCSNASIALSGSSSAAGATYSWTGPGGFTSADQNPAVTATGIYTLTVTDPSTGCTATDTANVAANVTAPGATATAGSPLTCNVTSVTITGSSSTAGVTYSWTGPGSFTSTDQNPVVNTAGTYTLTVSNPANGCTSTDTALVSFSNTTTGTLWLEDFTLANGTTVDNGATSWSTSVTPSTGVIAVNSNELRITNIGTTGEAVWTSGVIDISGKTNVNISTGVRSSIINNAVMNTTGEYADYLRFYYKLNGGAEVLFAERLGAINNHSTTPTSVSTGNLSGNTLQIVVRARATGNDEFYYFDNMQVAGTGTSTVTATATVDGVLTCANTSVNLSGSSATSGVTYSWTGPGGFSSSDQNTTASAAGTYYLTVTSSGCTAIDSVVVTANVTPPANVQITTDDTVITCTNNYRVLIAGTTTPGVTYQWLKPDGTTPTAIAIPATTAGVYYVTVTNTVNGCTASDSIVMTENKTPPSLSVSPNSAVLTCTNDSIVITATVSANASYYWVNSNNSDTVYSTMITATEPGAYHFSATDTTNGCNNNIFSFITQNLTAPSNAAITVTSASGSAQLTCTNNSVTLSGSATSSSSVAYHWTGPNGFESSAQAINVANPGEYALSVINLGTGCATTVSQTVQQNVVVPANVDISVNPVGGLITCTNDNVTLTGNSSTAGVSYAWTGPGGFTSVQQNPTVTVAGAYSVIVTDTANGCADTASTAVTQNITPPAGVTAFSSNELTCYQASTNLNGTSTTSGVTYSWTGPNGFTATTPMAATTVPGPYTFVVTDPSNGCTDTAMVSVTQNITPPANVTATNNGPITCALPNVTITGSSTTPGVDYFWTGPDDFFSFSAEDIVSAPGEYELIVTNLANGCADTVSTIVTEDFSVPQGVSINHPGGQITCLNPSMVLTGSTTTPNCSYSWTGPGTYAASAAAATVTAGGSYMLRVTSNANGCFTTAGTSVAEDKTPPAGVTAFSNNELTCFQNTTSLSGTPNSTEVSYEWRNPAGGLIANTRTTTASAAGNYTFIVTKTLNGCTDTAEVTVTQNITPPQNVTATNDGPLTCTVSEVTITGNSSTPGVDYFWSGPDGFFSFFNEDVVTTPGEYELIVTNLSNGCADTVTTVVEEDYSACSNAAKTVTQQTIAVNEKESAPEAATTAFEYKARPNPFTDKSFLEFRSQNSARVTVRLYNNIGVLEKELFNNTVKPNQFYKLTLDGNTLRAGAYYYLILVDGKPYTHKMILIK